MTETITHVAIKDLPVENYSDHFEGLPGIELSLTDDQRLIIEAEHLEDSPIITNDIVDMAGPSSFRWIERADDVINSGGLKIFPATLENQLDPLIEGEFFLTGMPDETLGQKLVLALVDPEQRIDMNSLDEQLRAKLPKNYVPKDILRINALLKTATGKIIKDLARYN